MSPFQGPEAVPERPAGDQMIPVYAHSFGSWQFTLQRRPLSLAELAVRYDRAAAGWSRTIDRLDYPQAYEGLLRAAVSDTLPVAPERPLRALDCGTGTGALSCALAHVVGAPLRLDALDLSEPMLARAGARFREAGVQAALHKADVQALPFRRDTFDIVMAAHLLEHLPDPRSALAEMVRVVRPGGLVVVCLTRRTMLGLYVHLRWRTHMVRDGEAGAWLTGAGLESVHRLVSGRRGVFRRLSMGWTGRKPVGGAVGAA